MSETQEPTVEIENGKVSEISEKSMSREIRSQALQDLDNSGLSAESKDKYGNIIAEIEQAIGSAGDEIDIIRLGMSDLLSSGYHSVVYYNDPEQLAKALSLSWEKGILSGINSDGKDKFDGNRAFINAVALHAYPVNRAEVLYKNKEMLKEKGMLLYNPNSKHESILTGMNDRLLTCKNVNELKALIKSIKTGKDLVDSKKDKRFASKQMEDFFKSIDKKLNDFVDKQDTFNIDDSDRVELLIDKEIDNIIESLSEIKGILSNAVRENVKDNLEKAQRRYDAINQATTSEV